MSFLVICILLILLHFGVPTSVGLQKQEKQIAAQSVATAPIKPGSRRRDGTSDNFSPPRYPKEVLCGGPGPCNEQ